MHLLCAIVKVRVWQKQLVVSQLSSGFQVDGSKRCVMSKWHPKRRVIIKLGVAGNPSYLGRNSSIAGTMEEKRRRTDGVLC